MNPPPQKKKSKIQCMLYEAVNYDFVGMFGKNNDENTAIDEVLGSIDDLWPPLRQGIHEQDETKKVNVIFNDSI